MFGNTTLFLYICKVKDEIKSKFRKAMRINALGYEVSRPNQQLILMRGTSGSGKSTRAKQLVGEGIIHSTDDLIAATHDYNAFFEEMRKKNSFSDLSRMHSKNLVNAQKSMREGISPVVIDNTNLRANEPKEYVKYALELGYADENIRIEDLGTGGLIAEELAARNVHGVPLEKIKSMISSHASVEGLTLKKILESKDMYQDSDVLYSAVLLDKASIETINKTFAHMIPASWNTYTHHMTIAFGKSVPNKSDVGKEVALIATHLGVSDKVIAVRVDGYPTLNAIPHVTVAVNPDGGTPRMSNDITTWEEITPIALNGVVSNIKKTG